MSFVKRERWAEAEVAALPDGEHDYFDRKSGDLLADPKFSAELAKALSAFANSGGGHLLLGVRDDGSFDGMDPLKGRTPLREWLEQKIPALVSYPLQDFRVHEVVPAVPSAIPEGKVVVVVDVGDSSHSPHQTEGSRIYYYRAGGHSRPAPHFYLETLRNRLVSPILTPTLERIDHLGTIKCEDGALFVELRMHYILANSGRMAAFHWDLNVQSMSGADNPRIADYVFGTGRLPSGAQARQGIKLPEGPLLPENSYIASKPFGVFLRPESLEAGQIEAEFWRVLPRSLSLTYRAVSESSIGASFTTLVSDVFDADGTLKRVLEYTASMEG